MTSARPVLIHVGMPRTATTSLQLNLFSRHPEACYIGKPLTRTRPEVARVTRGITYDVSLRSPSELTAFQKHCIVPLLAEHSGPVVISEEEFATSTPTSMISPQEIAERIHTLFPTAAILVTIRRQDHMIPSLFGHMVRMGMLDLEDWTPFMRAVQETPQLAAVADYAAVVARYEDLFGAHKVHVQAYEQLTEDPAAYEKEICRLARICLLYTSDAADE